MLVLSRKPGQSLIIDGKIEVLISRIQGNRVSVGIEAPQDVHVIRKELVQEEGDQVATTSPPE